MKKTYALHSENLTHLGGPMGTEYTYDNWVKYFGSIDKAKAYAQKDYQSETAVKQKLQWIHEEGDLRTEDLRFVMYHIKTIVLEDEVRELIKGVRSRKDKERGIP